MRWTIRLAVTAMALPVCFGLTLRGADTKPETPDLVTEKIAKAVKAVYAEMTVAAEAVDGEKLFSYVLENDNGCLISNGSITLTRRQAMEDYKTDSASIAAVDYNMDKQYVTVISPQTAVLAAEGRVDVTLADGRHFETQLAQTVVFVLKDGGWKVLHSHTSVPRR